MFRHLGSVVAKHGRLPNYMHNKEKAFARALRTSSYPQARQASYLPKNPFDTEKAKEQMEREGYSPEDSIEMNIQSTLPLEREDKEMKELEKRRIRALNSVDLWSHVVSCGIAILRSTPYQEMQKNGIKAVVNVQINAMQEKIRENRQEIQKALEQRIAQRREFEEYKKLQSQNVSFV